MIIIIDYGLGNLGSIKNMLRKIGFTSEISSDPEKNSEASKIILPGVGAFDTGMSRLNDLGMINLLNKKAFDEQIPVLGICLGPQLMCKGSEEGQLDGLGWFDADVLAFSGKFGEGKSFPVPNMGWIAKLAAGAVVAGKIGVNAIVANDGVIGTAAIADAQIASLNAAKITAGSIAAELHVG